MGFYFSLSLVLLPDTRSVILGPSASYNVLHAVVPVQAPTHVGTTWT